MGRNGVFVAYIVSCSQAQRKLNRKKENDKDLFDTFIQKMVKKDLNDTEAVLTNLEMIYKHLPKYIMSCTRSYIFLLESVSYLTSRKK
jgi:hypothetical protein